MLEANLASLKSDLEQSSAENHPYLKSGAADTHTDRCVNILGIRGIPAAHGGFETFAARLAPYLLSKGWKVNVYCQIEPDKDGSLKPDFEDDWEGIHRIHFGVRGASSSASVLFDWKCTRDVLNRPGIDLVLGYNTALFSLLQRMWGRTVFMNMDGIEWKRAKWKPPIKAWFYLNEFIGYNACSLPIADHPEIARHLKRHGSRKTVVIPYGSDEVSHASTETVTALGLEPDKYFISIARLEPENSILEMVRAFASKKRGMKLVVLGRIDPSSAYHMAIRAAASDEVIFPGPIYDPSSVSSLRFHCRSYLHGHQVGGTNPSLVEALGAGNPIIAHDNRFNRWVAGDDQRFFSTEADLSGLLDLACENSSWIASARSAARALHRDRFTWDAVLASYEHTLSSGLDSAARDLSIQLVEQKAEI